MFYNRSYASDIYSFDINDIGKNMDMTICWRIYSPFVYYYDLMKDQYELCELLVWMLNHGINYLCDTR